MNQYLLSVDNLRTWINTNSGYVRAVDGVSFNISHGETFALLGESGCGKSMTALSLLQLLPPTAYYGEESSVLLEQLNLLSLSEVAMRNIRGLRIGMIFQDPMISLNPVLTVGQQLAEIIRKRWSLSGNKLVERGLYWLDAVGIPAPKQRYCEYPHQLSGGMKQRVMIAMALSSEPELLIADEPTTALDVTIQAQILELLRTLQQRTKMAILLITHDLGVVRTMADRLAIMYAGHIVEQATVKEFFAGPRHPYSKRLLLSIPSIQHRGAPLETISGTVPSLQQEFSLCRFHSRCNCAISRCAEELPSWTKLSATRAVRCHLSENASEQQATNGEADKIIINKQSATANSILRVEDLAVYYPIKKGLLQRTVANVRAVDHIDLSVKAGSTLALVGESGCGKSTIGKAITQLIKPDAGNVILQDKILNKLPPSLLYKQRKYLQMIFQDPFSSLNPRMRVRMILEEGLKAQNIANSKQQRAKLVADFLAKVGLSDEFKMRYPHEFSGGQRQRISIARALVLNPKVIICDEPTSALDVSVQAQILNLLKQLQTELGLSYLFISHDISVVAYLADEIAVMYLGKIVEFGSIEQVLTKPEHPYTQALLAAVPSVNEDSSGNVHTTIGGEMPSPINPPAGCHFHPRCAHAMPCCRQNYPGITKTKDDHQVRCFLYSENL